MPKNTRDFNSCGRFCAGCADVGLLNNDHTAHSWVRGTVIRKASGSLQREDETSVFGHFRRTPCRRIRGRRVREGVVVDPLDDVAGGDRELRRHEGEFADLNDRRGSARGCGRIAARSDGCIRGATQAASPTQTVMRHALTFSRGRSPALVRRARDARRRRAAPAS